MSWIYQKVTKLFSSRPHHKIIMLGLDAAGKTTLLYKMKRPHEEVNTTIPTIGFNVETLEQHHYNITSWDVGGCDKIRPLWRHYTENTDLIIWVVDSNDKWRIEDTYHELHYMLSFIQDSSPFVRLLVVANKQDLPNAMPTDDIIKALHLHSLRIDRWQIISTAISSSAGDALRVGESIRFLLDAPHAREIAVQEYESTFQPKKEIGDEHAPIPVSAVVLPPSDTALVNIKGDVVVSTDVQIVTNEVMENNVHVVKQQRDLFQRDWIERVDCSGDQLLQQLNDCTLKEWDHYTHIRIAWLILRRYGSEAGFELIATKIKKMITHQSRVNSQEKAGISKRFHCTMTHFWCYMVNYSMQLQKQENNSPVEEAVEFKSFLNFMIENPVICPQLWFKALYKEWYSNEAMFSSNARDSVQPPDLQPLPMIVPTASALTNSCKKISNS